MSAPALTLYQRFLPVFTHYLSGFSSSPGPCPLSFSSFSQLADLLSASPLIADNEEIEEIPTKDMTLLLFPFLFSEFLISQPGASDRLARVSRAVFLLEGFVSQQRHLGLFSKDDELFITKYSENEKVLFSPIDRQEKIARFQREKRVKEKITEFLKRREAAGRGKMNLGDGEEENFPDEEIERALIKELFQLCGQQAVENLRSARQELAMLKQAEERKNAEPPRPPEEKKPLEFMRFNSPKELENAQIPAAFQKHFTSLSSLSSLSVDRQRVLASVFRESNPHTISIEQFIQQEIEQGRIPQSQTNTQAAPEDPAESAEDYGESSLAAADRAQAEARAWDNWKDDHEKGAGNKMKRY